MTQRQATQAMQPTAPPVTPESVAELILSRWPSSAEEVTSDVLRIVRERRAPQRRCHVSVRRARALVCRYYSVAESDLIGPRRGMFVMEARYAFGAVLHERLGLSLTETARVTGRTYTAVCYGIGRLKRTTDQWQTLTAALDGRSHPESTY